MYIFLLYFERIKEKKEGNGHTLTVYVSGVKTENGKIAVGEIEIKAYRKYDVSSGSIEYSIPKLTSNTSYGEVTSDTIFGTQHDVYYA